MIFFWKTKQHSGREEEEDASRLMKNVFCSLSLSGYSGCERLMVWDRMLILSCRVWLHLRLPVTHSPSPSHLHPCPNGKDCYLCRKPVKGKQDTPGLQTWALSGAGFQPDVAALVYQEERSRKEERSYLTHFPKMSVPSRGNPVTMNRWDDVFFSWKWKIRECRHAWQALTELLSLNGCFHKFTLPGITGGPMHFSSKSLN